MHGSLCFFLISWAINKHKTQTTVSTSLTISLTTNNHSNAPMSFLKVPEPVKELFDAFPRHQFPSTRQHTAAEKQALEGRRYSYGATTKQAPTHFTLCVYNVFQTAESTYLATDPMCLSAELSLALRNQNPLPKANHDHTDRARNAVFITSAHAHPEGHLPLYIEEDPLRKTRRLTRNCVAIEETLVSRVESSSELMLITLIDSVVYDAWMTCIFLDVEDSVKSEIYQYQQTTEHQWVNKMGLSGIMSQLLTRNGFSLRNRQISKLLDTTYTATALMNTVLPRTDRGVQFEKQRNYREFTHALESITSILERKGTQFFGGVQPGLLDIKLCSYVVLIQRYLSGTELYQSLDKLPVLSTHAQAVLRACS